MEHTTGCPQLAEQVWPDAHDPVPELRQTRREDGKAGPAVTSPRRSRWIQPHPLARLDDRLLVTLHGNSARLAQWAVERVQPLFSSDTVFKSNYTRADDGAAMWLNAERPSQWQRARSAVVSLLSTTLRPTVPLCFPGAVSGQERSSQGALGAFLVPNVHRAAPAHESCSSAPSVNLRTPLYIDALWRELFLVGWLFFFPRLNHPQTGSLVGRLTTEFEFHSSAKKSLLFLLINEYYQENNNLVEPI